MGGVIDAISGGFGANASKRAAKVQQAAADRGIEAQEGAISESAADLDPFITAGQNALTGLESGLEGAKNLVESPEAQRDFITNNPFFDALTERSTQTLLSNKAAKGKVGSGGTAEALQNSLLLLGSDLLNQNLTQRQNVNSQFQNLANTGTSAAGTLSGLRTGSATQVGNLHAQNAQAQAAGIIGASNQRRAGLESLANDVVSAVSGGFSPAGGAGGAAGGISSALQGFSL